MGFFPMLFIKKVWVKRSARGSEYSRSCIHRYQFTTFDNAYIVEFLARESVFKVYTEYAGGNIKANDAINKVVKKSKQTGIQHMSTVAVTCHVRL